MSLQRLRKLEREEKARQAREFAQTLMQDEDFKAQFMNELKSEITMEHKIERRVRKIYLIPKQLEVENVRQAKEIITEQAIKRQVKETYYPADIFAKRMYETFWSIIVYSQADRSKNYELALDDMSDREALLFLISHLNVMDARPRSQPLPTYPQNTVRVTPAQLEDLLGYTRPDATVAEHSKLPSY